MRNRRKKTAVALLRGVPVWTDHDLEGLAERGTAAAIPTDRAQLGATTGCRYCAHVSRFEHRQYQYQPLRQRCLQWSAPAGTRRLVRGHGRQLPGVTKRA